LRALSGGGGARATLGTLLHDSERALTAAPCVLVASLDLPLRLRLVLRQGQARLDSCLLMELAFE